MGMAVILVQLSPTALFRRHCCIVIASCHRIEFNRLVSVVFISFTLNFFPLSSAVVDRLYIYRLIHYVVAFMSNCSCIVNLLSSRCCVIVSPLLLAKSVTLTLNFLHQLFLTAKPFACTNTLFC